MTEVRYNDPLRGREPQAEVVGAGRELGPVPGEVGPRQSLAGFFDQEPDHALIRSLGCTDQSTAWAG